MLGVERKSRGGVAKSVFGPISDMKVAAYTCADRWRTSERANDCAADLRTSAATSARLGFAAPRRSAYPARARLKLPAATAIMMIDPVTISRT